MVTNMKNTLSAIYGLKCVQNSLKIGSIVVSNIECILYFKWVTNKFKNEK